MSIIFSQPLLTTFTSAYRYRAEWADGKHLCSDDDDDDDDEVYVHLDDWWRAQYDQLWQL